VRELRTSLGWQPALAGVENSHNPAVVSEKIGNFSRTLPRKFRRKTWCWIIFKISMNAISISVRLRIFSNFFKKWRALPKGLGQKSRVYASAP
jgi:hypothetical protein